MTSTSAAYALRQALITAPTSGVDARHLMNAYRDEILTEAAAAPAVSPKPRSRFSVVYEAPVANSHPVIADEIRCLDCQSITGMAGVFSPTLAELDALADRHTCLPRFPKES